MCYHRRITTTTPLSQLMAIVPTKDPQVACSWPTNQDHPFSQAMEHLFREICRRRTRFSSLCSEPTVRFEQATVGNSRQSRTDSAISNNQAKGIIRSRFQELCHSEAMKKAVQQRVENNKVETLLQHALSSSLRR
jgi:hypothetical protein